MRGKESERDGFVCIIVLLEVIPVRVCGGRSGGGGRLCRHPYRGWSVGAK